jgi:CheY-like chemotaxis protein
MQIEKAMLSKKYEKMFLASFTHELITPLNGILGLIETLQCHQVPESCSNMLKIIKNNGLLLRYLVLDVIRLYKEDGGSSKDWINIKDIIEECTTLYEFGFQHKKLNMIIEYGIGTPKLIYADGSRYRQVIINLLGNALKYTMRGSVRIAVSYEPSQKQLMTTIEDTGIGMSEEETTKLFQLFGKVDNSCALNPQGIGLGLSSCYTHANSLQGTINVTSQQNKGTSFTLTFPCEVKDTVIEENIKVKLCWEEESDRKSTSQPNKKCDCREYLITDDTELNRFVIKRFLQKHNGTADEALNGKEAIDLVSERAKKSCCKNYSLIFMDINMPVMDGDCATQILREKMEKCEIPYCPIVAVTAARCEDPEQRAEFKKKGFNDCGINS